MGSGKVKAIALIILVVSFFSLPYAGVFSDTSTTGVTVFISQCSDGIDNDGDSLTDYPDDPGCDSPTDDDETNTSSGGGGGGGGGGSIIIQVSTTKVIFSGRAYPTSFVSLMKDAQIVATTVAGDDSKFSISFDNLTAGVYVFGVYTQDRNGRRSNIRTFQIGITQGATTNVSGIFLSPTIDVDKSVVRRGDNLAIFGQSVPESEITISVNSHQGLFAKTLSDKDGVYLYNLDTSNFHDGVHSAKSKAAVSDALSGFSFSVNFSIGNRNIAKTHTGFLKGDLNNDGRIDLVDFSIASFWYKKLLNDDSIILREINHLNGDGLINLVDFSIMAFYWTG